LFAIRVNPRFVVTTMRVPRGTRIWEPELSGAGIPLGAGEASSAKTAVERLAQMSRDRMRIIPFVALWLRTRSKGVPMS
jgi:hypothetical protein